jgi:hypothetical protein
MYSHIFIVTDLGNLKVYRAEKVLPGREPRLSLVNGFSLVDAHLKVAEKYTDEAGAFPTQTGAGPRQTVQGNSIAERHNIEETRRLVRLIAQHITDILRAEDPKWWSLAVPPKIQKSLLEELEPETRQHLMEIVPRDLVNTPPDELLEHFDWIRVGIGQ